MEPKASSVALTFSFLRQEDLPSPSKPYTKMRFDVITRQRAKMRIDVITRQSAKMRFGMITRQRAKMRFDTGFLAEKYTCVREMAKF